MGYIIKPVDEGVLIPAVEIAISKYNEIKKLNKECQKAKIALEERKYVDQAKNIIMNKYNISEKEAYTYIRKTAMDKGCKIGEIAKFIINSN